MFLFDLDNLGGFRMFHHDICDLRGLAVPMIYGSRISEKKIMNLRRRRPEKTTGATAPASGFV